MFVKESISVHGIKIWNDVNTLKNGIVMLDGIIACEINKKELLVNIVYDDKILDLDEIKNEIEDMGY